MWACVCVCVGGGGGMRGMGEAYITTAVYVIMLVCVRTSVRGIEPFGVVSATREQCPKHIGELCTHAHFLYTRSRCMFSNRDDASPTTPTHASHPRHTPHKHTDTWYDGRNETIGPLELEGMNCVLLYIKSRVIGFAKSRRLKSLRTLLWCWNLAHRSHIYTSQRRRVVLRLDHAVCVCGGGG